jgi:hypothetical protein
MPSVFVDSQAPPDETGLRGVLGKAWAAWDALLVELRQPERRLGTEWKFYGRAHGWQLKASSGTRAVLYLVPGRGSFTAALALRDGALAALRASDLPRSLVRRIEGAKAFAEGRPARVEVTGKQELRIVKTLLAIKLAS